MINQIIQHINKFKTHQFRNDFIYSYIVNLITMFSGLVLMFLINRYGSLSTYGEVSIVLAFGGILNNIITAKSNEGVVKFAIKFKNNNEYNKVNQIILFSLIVDFVLASIAILLFSLSAHIASDFLLKDESKYMLIVYFGVIVAMKLLRNALMGYLQSEQKISSINNFTLLDIVLKVFLIGFLVASSHNLTSENVIISYMIGAIITTISLFLYALPHILKLFYRYGISFCKDTYKEFYFFTKTMYLATFIRGFAADMDNIILGFFTNPQTVGIYQVVKNLISPITLISSPMGLIYYPVLNNLYEQNKINAFRSKIKRVTTYVTIISLGILIFLIPFDMYILRYFNIEASSEIFSFFLLQGLFMLIITIQWWIRIFCNIIDIGLYLKVNIFWVLHLGLIGSLCTYLYGIYGMYFSGILMVLTMHKYFLERLYKTDRIVNKIGRKK